jgi:hypothetical protein
MLLVNARISAKSIPGDGGWASGGAAYDERSPSRPHTLHAKRLARARGAEIAEGMLVVVARGKHLDTLADQRRATASRAGSPMGRHAQDAGPKQLALERRCVPFLGGLLGLGLADQDLSLHKANFAAFARFPFPQDGP